MKNKNNFYPPRNRHKYFDNTIDFIKQQNLNNLSKNKTNLGKKYSQALKELRNDKSIVVNEADKGGTMVIMNPEYYEKMIHKQLEDKNTCKKLDPSCDNITMRANTHSLKSMKTLF